MESSERESKPNETNEFNETAEKPLVRKRSGNKSEMSLDNVDILDLSNTVEDECNWLHDSRRHVSSQNISPYTWVREGFEDPSLKNVKMNETLRWASLSLNGKRRSQPLILSRRPDDDDKDDDDVESESKYETVEPYPQNSHLNSGTFTRKPKSQRSAVRPVPGGDIGAPFSDETSELETRNSEMVQVARTPTRSRKSILRQSTVVIDEAADVNESLSIESSDVTLNNVNNGLRIGNRKDNVLNNADRDVFKSGKDCNMNITGASVLNSDSVGASVLNNVTDTASLVGTGSAAGPAGDGSKPRLAGLVARSHSDVMHRPSALKYHQRASAMGLQQQHPEQTDLGVEPESKPTTEDINNQRNNSIEANSEVAPPDQGAEGKRSELSRDRPIRRSRRGERRRTEVPLVDPNINKPLKMRSESYTLIPQNQLVEISLDQQDPMIMSCDPQTLKSYTDNSEDVQLKSHTENSQLKNSHMKNSHAENSRKKEKKLVNGSVPQTALKKEEENECMVDETSDLLTQVSKSLQPLAAQQLADDDVGSMSPVGLRRSMNSEALNMADDGCLVSLQHKQEFQSTEHALDQGGAANEIHCGAGVRHDVMNPGVHAESSASDQQLEPDLKQLKIDQHEQRIDQQSQQLDQPEMLFDTQPQQLSLQPQPIDHQQQQLDHQQQLFDQPQFQQQLDDSQPQQQILQNLEQPKGQSCDDQLQQFIQQDVVSISENLQEMNQIEQQVKQQEEEERIKQQEEDRMKQQEQQIKQQEEEEDRMKQQEQQIKQQEEEDRMKQQEQQIKQQEEEDRMKQQEQQIKQQEEEDRMKQQEQQIKQQEEEDRKKQQEQQIKQQEEEDRMKQQEQQMKLLVEKQQQQMKELMEQQEQLMKQFMEKQKHEMELQMKQLQQPIEQKQQQVAEQQINDNMQQQQLKIEGNGLSQATGVDTEGVKKDNKDSSSVRSGIVRRRAVIKPLAGRRYFPELADNNLSCSSEINDADQSSCDDLNVAFVDNITSPDTNAVSESNKLHETVTADSCSPGKISEPGVAERMRGSAARSGGAGACAGAGTSAGVPEPVSVFRLLQPSPRRSLIRAPSVGTARYSGATQRDVSISPTKELKALPGQSFVSQTSEENRNKVVLRPPSRTLSLKATESRVGAASAVPMTPRTERQAGAVTQRNASQVVPTTQTTPRTQPNVPRPASGLRQPRPVSVVRQKTDGVPVQRSKSTVGYSSHAQYGTLGFSVPEKASGPGRGTGEVRAQSRNEVGVVSGSMSGVVSGRASVDVNARRSLQFTGRTVAGGAQQQQQTARARPSDASTARPTARSQPSVKSVNRSVSFSATDRGLSRSTPVSNLSQTGQVQPTQRTPIVRRSNTTISQFRPVVGAGEAAGGGSVSRVRNGAGASSGASGHRGAAETGRNSAVPGVTNNISNNVPGSTSSAGPSSVPAVGLRRPSSILRSRLDSSLTTGGSSSGSRPALARDKSVPVRPRASLSVYEAGAEAGESPGGPGEGGGDASGDPGAELRRSAIPGPRKQLPKIPRASSTVSRRQSSMV